MCLSICLLVHDIIILCHVCLMFYRLICFFLKCWTWPCVSTASPVHGSCTLSFPLTRKLAKLMSRNQLIWHKSIGLLPIVMRYVCILTLEHNWEAHVRPTLLTWLFELPVCMKLSVFRTGCWVNSHSAIHLRSTILSGLIDFDLCVLEQCLLVKDCSIPLARDNLLQDWLELQRKKEGKLLGHTTQTTNFCLPTLTSRLACNRLSVFKMLDFIWPPRDHFLTKFDQLCTWFTLTLQQRRGRSGMVKSQSRGRLIRNAPVCGVHHYHRILYG